MSRGFSPLRSPMAAAALSPVKQDAVEAHETGRICVRHVLVAAAAAVDEYAARSWSAAAGKHARRFVNSE